MIDNASKAFFHLLARSGTLKNLASRYGMRSSTSFARRFIAGETVEEAIEAARRIEAAGLLQTLDYLGESVGSLADRTVTKMDLERALARLPEGCRAAFVLHDVEGLEHREVAEVLGIAEGTSKSQVHKARLKLRALLSGS